MKKLIMTVVLASLVPASAFAEKIVAQVASVNQDIASVQLTDRGDLKIQRRDGRLLVESLVTVNANRLAYFASSLASAELVTDKRDVVCMMMIAPFFMQTLEVADSKTGELKPVLTPNGCWARTYTHPKDVNLLANAQKLEELLTFSAAQYTQ